MSERAWDDFHGNPTYLIDWSFVYGDFGGATTFTSGGVADQYNGFWGWAGLGGSVFQWNPDYQVSFGYVPSDLLPEVVNERGYYLRDMVIECIDRMESGDWEESDDDRDGRGGKSDLIDWSEDKDRIIMTGADGSMLYIEMGATKIAASLSAAAFAAMTLW